MTFGKIYFGTPESLAGENPLHAWMRYLKERDAWEITTDPGEDVDVIFFGDDAVLSDELLERDAYKICFFWDFAPWRFLSPQFRAWVAGKVEQMRKCDLVLVPSRVVSYQIQMLGIRPTICVPGIDSRLMDSIDGHEKKHQVCSVSRLAPHKQHDWVIKAASMVDPKPRVVVCGAGDPKPLEDFAERLGVDLTVGPVSDEEKVRRIKESMCFVSSSTWEGFGMGPVEAMYAGVPVLAYDMPTHREILKEFVIFFNSPVDLARKMAFLFGNESLREEMFRRGREYVKNNLTFDRAANRLECVLSHVINEISGRRVRANPTPERWKDVYNTVAVRNKRYYAYRFDPRWSRYWEAPIFMQKFRECNAKNILDVGSGAVHPVIFAMNGFNVTAFDVSDVVIQQGREMAEEEGVSGMIEWRQGFAEELPYEDGAFDAVLQSELLEHVKEPERVLSEGLRVLKPNGHLIIGVPLDTHYADPLHLNIFSIGDIEGLVNKFSDRCEVVGIETIAEPRTEPSVIMAILKKRSLGVA